MSLRWTSDLCDITGSCWAELAGRSSVMVACFMYVSAYILVSAIFPVLKLRCDGVGIPTIS